MQAYEKMNEKLLLSPTRRNSMIEMDVENDLINRENPIIPKVEPPELNLYPEQDKSQEEKIDDDVDVGVLDFEDLTEDDSAHQQLFGLRRQRKFILESDKDEIYWDRRKRNNEAAKRSREKRRVNDMILESRVMELSKQNNVLRAQLDAMHIRDQRPGPIPFGGGYNFNGNANVFCPTPQNFFQNNRFPYFPSNIQYSSPLPQFKEERENMYDSISRRNTFGQQNSYGDVPVSYGNNNYIAPHFPKLVPNSHLSNMGQNLPIDSLPFQQAIPENGAPPIKSSRKRLNSDPTSDSIINPLQHSPPTMHNRDILVASRHRHYSTAGHSLNTLSQVETNTPFTFPNSLDNPTSLSSYRTVVNPSSAPSMETSPLTTSTPSGSTLLSSLSNPNTIPTFKDLSGASKSLSFSPPRYERGERSLSFSFPSSNDAIVNQNFSESRQKYEQKTSNLEITGEKRKHFIINDMLEQSKAYPQDLDTALNLSYPTEPEAVSQHVRTKNHGSHTRFFNNSSPKSFRRVPSISSENGNNDQSQNKSLLTPNNSASGCSSPTESTHSSTSDNGGSSDASNSKIFSSKSLNDTFIPYKFRFKSGLFDDSQNSFGYRSKTSKSYETCE